MAEARAGQHDGPPWTLTPTARSSRARSVGSRARSAASPSAARSAARRDRAEPVRPRRRAVPDDVLRDLPPPRRRDLAARSSRRRRALDAPRRRRPASSPRAAHAPTTSSARSGATSPRGETGRDGGASLELGVGGAGPHRLAQVPARARRVRARASRLRARRAHRRRARAALAGPLLHRPSSRLASTAMSAELDDAGAPRVGGGRPPARGRARRPRALRAPAPADRRRHGGAPQAGRADVHARRARRRLPRRGALGARRGRDACAVERLAPRPRPRPRRCVPRRTSAAPSTTSRDHAGRATVAEPPGAAARRGSLALVAAAILLAAGIALGMALHDNPNPNLTVTTTKTFVP